MGMIGNTVRRLLSPHKDRTLAWRAFETLDSAQSEVYRFNHGKLTMWGSVQNLCNNGFHPGAIIDCGAYRGFWAEEVAKIYPGVPILMIEGNPELSRALEAARTKIKNAEIVVSVLGPEARAANTFYIADAATGSSVLEDTTRFPRTPVTLPIQTLDGVMRERSLTAPYLLKLDLQGYEYEVLCGADQTLKNTEVILAELSFLPLYKSTKLAGETITLLNDRGFVLYDICSQLRRESDQAAAQIDAIFVRKDSALRSQKAFFLSEAWSDEKLASENQKQRAREDAAVPP